MALIKKRSVMAGLPPGSLVYIGGLNAMETRIDVIDFTEAEASEQRVGSIGDCEEYLSRDSITWINVTGLGNVELLRSIGERFSIHALVLADILNTGKRSKFEEHDDYLFLILRMLHESADNSIASEQVSLFVGNNLVVSFCEQDGSVLAPVAERILSGKGRIRKSGSDYLAYAIMDVIVDGYFPMLEDLGGRIETIQSSAIGEARPEQLQDIDKLKQSMMLLRKNVLPLREVANRFELSEHELVDEKLGPYLRNVYEHTIQIIDLMEMLRDMTESAFNTYMTTVSNRMNEIMKVLTVIATIFIPLTFIAGVYGMNFENMPELKIAWAYGIAWAVMIAMAVSMLIFFRRKRWI
ncbi:magnesium/cobalt transporter CorA [Pontiella desulfatans]|nr:magnesium/cobalt transporter CorA [Pontiella desulfatans]